MAFLIRLDKIPQYPSFLHPNGTGWHHAGMSKNPVTICKKQTQFRGNPFGVNPAPWYWNVQPGQCFGAVLDSTREQYPSGRHGLRNGHLPWIKHELLAGIISTTGGKIQKLVKPYINPILCTKPRTRWVPQRNQIRLNIKRLNPGAQVGVKSCSWIRALINYSLGEDWSSLRTAWDAQSSHSTGDSSWLYNAKHYYLQPNQLRLTILYKLDE